MPGPLKFRRRWTGIFAGLFILFFGFSGSFVLWFWLVLSPLQKQYFPTYLAVEMTGTLRTFPVWWIWKTGPKRKPELAGEADVIPSAVTQRGQLPLSLSPEARSQGWTGLLRAKQMDSPTTERTTLQEEFFAGESVARMMITPLCGAAALFPFVPRAQN